MNSMVYLTTHPTNPCEFRLCPSAVVVVITDRVMIWTKVLCLVDLFSTLHTYYSVYCFVLILCFNGNERKILFIKVKFKVKSMYIKLKSF